MTLIIGKVISLFRSFLNMIDMLTLIHRQSLHHNWILYKNKTLVTCKAILLSPFAYIILSAISIYIITKHHVFESKNINYDLFTTQYFAERMNKNLYHKSCPVNTREDLDRINQNKPISFAFYYLRTGDTLFSVAKKFRLSMSTVLSLNTLDNVNMMQPNQKILLASASGIIYHTSHTETVEEIANRYKISIEEILITNPMINHDIPLNPGTTLFLPNASLSHAEMTKILGYTFMNPVPGYRRLSSHFGWRRHPKSKQRRLHSGIDLSAPHGTRILAAREGRVIFCGACGNAGLTTKIKHNNGLTTVYAHQAKSVVKSGTWVKTGQHIGYVGNTGLTTGPHLHFEVRKFGYAKNPLYSGLKLR